MHLTRFGLAATAALMTLFGAAHAADKPYVATTAIVEHPALDAVRDGVREALAEAGYGEGDLKFTYESAQGNPATAAQIARKLVGEEPDVIVAIATPSAQAVVSATQEIPVVFSAVTDPKGAKLVQDLEHPGGNVTGFSDMVPVDRHIDLIKEIVPDAKRIGVPYNPGEPNAVSLVNMLEEVAPEKGVGIVTAAAPKSSDVMTAAQSLVGKADVFYILTDNTVVTALESVIKVGIDNKIPVFAADTGSVDRGAVAALGFNYHDMGLQTGQVVARILKGENPGDIPVRVAETNELYVNKKMAEAMGVTIPDAVLKRATKVVE